MSSSSLRELNCYKTVVEKNPQQILRNGYTNLAKIVNVLPNPHETNIEWTFGRHYHRGIIRILKPRLDEELMMIIFNAACSYGYLDVVKETVGWFGHELIRDVIQEGHVDVFNYLLTLPHFSLNDSSMVYLAANLPTAKILRKIVETVGEDWFRSLIQEARDFGLETSFGDDYFSNIRLLLKYGFDPNEPLIRSVHQGRDRMVKFLIKHGADPHIHTDQLIREATVWKWPKIIQYLFDVGSRPSINLFQYTVEVPSLDIRERVLPTVELVLRLFPPTPEQIREAIPTMIRYDLIDTLLRFSEYIRSGDIQFIELESGNSPETLSVLLKYGASLIGFLKRIVYMVGNRLKIRDVKSSIEDFDLVVITLDKFIRPDFIFPELEIEEAIKDLWSRIRMKEILRSRLYTSMYDPNRDIRILTDNPQLQYLLQNTFRVVQISAPDRLAPILHLDPDENPTQIVQRAFDVVLFECLTLDTDNIYTICGALSQKNWFFQAIVPQFPYQYNPYGIRVSGRSFDIAYHDYMKSVPDHLKEWVQTQVLQRFGMSKENRELDFFDLYNFLITL